MNGKDYKVFEEEKEFIVEEDQSKKTIKLRRINIWNKSSNRRTCCLAWDAGKKLSTVQCAEAILSRWGASEYSGESIRILTQIFIPFLFHNFFCYLDKG